MRDCIIIGKWLLGHSSFHNVVQFNYGVSTISRTLYGTPAFFPQDHSVQCESIYERVRMQTLRGSFIRSTVIAMSLMRKAQKGK